MWNDTEIPLAIFFTFRCYGTWLHGDERGSIDRHNNVYGTARIYTNNNWNKFNENQLNREPVLLDTAQRKSVENSVKDTCKIRAWILLAANVRTNHIHIVASIGKKSPQQALIALKANATRQLRDDGLWNCEHTPWADKGSKRKLWNEKSIGEAIDYVLYGQGDEFPDFER